MSAEENSARIGYQMKPDERSFVRKFIWTIITTISEMRKRIVLLKTLVVRTFKKSCRVPRLSHKTWFYIRIKEARLLSQRLYNIAGSSGFLKAWDVRAVCITMCQWNRYYNILKNELIYQYRFETAAELDYAVSEFAYDECNQVRPHSYSEYLTPFE